ncbi:adenylyltransferase/cytidyltransferase family protein [Sphingobacterium detergens]|uniref:Cytidyltransferase-like protein n=1 Tax=Sphingobacterium detergens TaxID=1145106 RepID=A0A420BKF0_SPHD1|nr:adenylyltransferase/cytidyltransferase family protein [Sphingobacterium detergens]RKE57193.1 cytidyltransferase-like protein [Sphingobacterium detergens]
MNTYKVVADMTADLFHRGHVNFLHNVKNYFKPDDVHLTIALHTDEQIFSYKKRYPIMDFECRKEVLLSCRYVDHVITAPDIFDNNFISPFDYLIHGDDVLNWPPELIHFYYGTAKSLNKFLLIPYTKGISTTILRESLKNGQE